MKGPSPLIGYNTNVRHRGKLYHIQTEDSGLRHPHIITHLFADGGRILASRKTGYAEHIGAPNQRDVIKNLMREQHKAMFIALRDGVYDEDATGPTPSGAASPPSVPAPGPRADVDALERAAARLATKGSVPTAGSAPAGRFQPTRVAQVAGAAPRAPESIFGSDLLSEKSLDEVILSYLAEDLEEAD